MTHTNTDLSEEPGSRLRARVTLLRQRRRKTRIKVLLLTFGTKMQRQRYARTKRMDWEERVGALTEKGFTRRHRLDLDSFELVLAKIKPHLPQERPNVPNQLQHELLLAMALRWCAGGSYLDICDMHGCAEPTFFAHLWSTLLAIDTAYQLRLMEMLEPANIAAGSLSGLAAGFDRKSGGVFAGCIGALDGIQIKIERPQYQGARYHNYKGFFSVNMQAVVDSRRRFIHMSVLTCGSTHDATAFGYSDLGKLLDDPAHPIHDTEYWIAGDDAYKGPANRSRSLLTPYPGKGLSDEDDAFNAYQSKCRIEVECAFGAFTKRWGVLHRALTCSVPNVCLLLSALTKLHNVCMEQRIPEHAGRVMRDTFASASARLRYGGADMRGVEWPEWRVPARFYDAPARVEGRRRNTAQRRAALQPLRTTLTAALNAADMRRPRRADGSASYQGYRHGF